MKAKWAASAVFLAALLAVGCTPNSAVFAFPEQAVAQEQQTPLETGVATISETDLREALTVFAGREMNGRGTINDGYKKPSQFIEEKLKKFGLTPKGDLLSARLTNDGLVEEYSYFQNFFYNQRIPSRNVIGCIDGQNKEELVVVGAHYDHLGRGEVGIREGEIGDIFYGADDNGSGTVATLAVAEALMKLSQKGIKPKRSILICLWGMEEWGEIGSRHFIKNLPRGVDKEKIVGYVNMDMVGRNAVKSLYVLCANAPRGNVEALPGPCAPLYELAEEVNKKLKLEFRISHFDVQMGFERTDGWTFYQAIRNNRSRIPTWELFTGEHDDYHTPRDTADKIDYGKLARVARLAFGIAWTVSEMDGKPAYK